MGWALLDFGCMHRLGSSLGRHMSHLAPPNEETRGDASFLGFVTQVGDEDSYILDHSCRLCNV